MKSGKKSKPLSLKGVGIDILSTHRTNHLVKKRESFICKRMLTDKEVSVWRKSRFSAKHLTKLLTAKEAYFKALGGSWMGPDGFKSFQVTILDDVHFKVEHRGAKSPLKGAGTFFCLGPRVGAQYLVWR